MGSELEKDVLLAQERIKILEEGEKRNLGHLGRIEAKVDSLITEFQVFKESIQKDQKGLGRDVEQMQKTMSEIENVIDGKGEKAGLIPRIAILEDYVTQEIQNRREARKETRKFRYTVYAGFIVSITLLLIKVVFNVG